MSVETTVRIANTVTALERMLEGIEAGERPRPDWIHLQGKCRIDRLPGQGLEALLRRLHACVLRGFRARNARPRGRLARLAFWQCVARNGFHDFSDLGWMKAYGSPFVESYDYVSDYQRGGVAALDPYRVYSAVLGTHDYTVEDFLHTASCEKVETIVEPMAGTGEFSYAGHFLHPDLRYVLFDLDPKARDHVMARAWLPGADYRYEVADVLSPAIWRQVKGWTRGRSLSYIGKQSHHFFDARQLHQLLSVGTKHVDYFVLESPEASLVSDLEQVDDLTRPEMEDAGFEVALVEEEDSPPNPFTNELGFRLDVWDEHERRTLFRYRDWTSWQPPMLVTLARLLDLDVLYLNEDVSDFVSVDGDLDHSDCLENVSFMLFKRRG